MLDPKQMALSAPASTEDVGVTVTVPVPIQPLLYATVKVYNVVVLTLVVGFLTLGSLSPTSGDQE